MGDNDTAAACQLVDLTASTDEDVDEGGLATPAKRRLSRRLPGAQRARTAPAAPAAGGSALPRTAPTAHAAESFTREALLEPPPALAALPPPPRMLSQQFEAATMQLIRCVFYFQAGPIPAPPPAPRLLVTTRACPAPQRTNFSPAAAFVGRRASSAVHGAFTDAQARRCPAVMRHHAMRKPRGCEFMHPCPPPRTPCPCLTPLPATNAARPV